MLARLALVLVAAQAPSHYRAVLLDTLGYSGSQTQEQARGIDDAGECCGYVDGAAGWSNAAKWSADGTLTMLGHPNKQPSGAHDIANGGSVEGFGISDVSFALVWTTSGTYLPLGILSQATGISESGAVACFFTGPYGNHPNSYVVRKGKFFTLIAHEATTGRMNELEMVAGT